LINPQEVVTPVLGLRRNRVTVVQTKSNTMKILDSGFRRNDGKGGFQTSYEACKYFEIFFFPVLPVSRFRGKISILTNSSFKSAFKCETGPV